MNLILDGAVEWIAELHQAGLGSVPLCSPTTAGSCTGAWHPSPCGGVDGKQAGKRPLSAGYVRLAQEVPLLQALINQFYLPFASVPINLGIVVPDRHVIVEADTLEADHEITALLDDTVTATRSARPSRGRAWIFRLPSQCPPITSMTKLGASKAIDVRGPGGILVAPPSRHRSGYVYEWVVGPSMIAELPVGLMQFLMSAEERSRIGRHLACLPSGPSISSPASPASPNSDVELAPIVSSTLAPWVPWAFSSSSSVAPSEDLASTTQGAVRSSTGSRSTLSHRCASYASPPQLLRASLRTAAEQGWVDPAQLPCGKGFPSRSELLHAIMTAWVAAGVDAITAVEALLSLPFSEKAQEQQDGHRWLRAEYRRAYHAVLDEIDRAVVVTCEWINLLPGTLKDGARTRGMLYLHTDIGKQINHEIVVVLGPPHDGETAGDFLEAVRSFEPRVPTAERGGRASWGKRWRDRDALAVLDEDGRLRRLYPLDVRPTTFVQTSSASRTTGATP